MLKTLKDKYEAALIKCGEREVNLGASKKWTQWTRTGRVDAHGRETFYFVGTAGSLRFGRTYTESLPCGERFKKLLLESVVMQPAPSHGAPGHHFSDRCAGCVDHAYDRYTQR